MQISHIYTDTHTHICIENVEQIAKRRKQSGGACSSEFGKYESIRNENVMLNRSNIVGLHRRRRRRRCRFHLICTCINAFASRYF